MSDKNRTLTRRREKKEKEAAEVTKDVKEVKKEGEQEEQAVDNGEVPPAEAEATNGAVANGQDEDLKVEPMEVPPFELIQGVRLDPLAFKFQFKNVEYSSGRNKTYLCYLVEKGTTALGLLRGYLEDEHIGSHAEEAFFLQVLTPYDPEVQYTVTWYVSSSPCTACAAKIAEVLQARKNIKMKIFAARLFEWEEPEIQAGLKAMHAAGCKLRVMRPLDYSYIWDTFVDNEDEPLMLWEDCQENYEYYQERLADILQ